ncbi:MAG: hypothetical protein LBT56_00130 [Prevotellaceae bacterium]|jgi:hypothetical protein|nr:hypothetical protein [Prevotellaceae bacterium]
MKILTKDNRLLTLLRISEVDGEHGSDKITCRDGNGKIVVIQFCDVQLAFGSYNFIN